MKFNLNFMSKTVANKSVGEKSYHQNNADDAVVLLT